MDFTSESACDVWSCRELKADGFPLKGQSQVKISGGWEEVDYEEDFGSSGKGVSVKDPEDFKDSEAL